MINLPKKKRKLRRLQKAGFLQYKNGAYFCNQPNLNLYEDTFTDENIADFLCLMQNEAGKKFFFQSAAPMSVNSWSPGPK